MSRRVSAPSPEAEDAVFAFRASEYGRLKEIAKELGITKQAISGWRAVPAEWVKQLSAVTGIPPWILRPDLYTEPPSKRRSRKEAEQP